MKVKIFFTYYRLNEEHLCIDCYKFCYDYFKRELMRGNTMSAENRCASRMPIRMRVDCKPLSGSEVRDILEGRGYSELAFASLALSRPRQGMLPSRVKNLSMGGLCMEGPLPLGLGEAAALDMHLPDERVALKALVEVVWTKPATGDDQPHACGLRFAAMDEESTRRLKLYLSVATADVCFEEAAGAIPRVRS
jgi:Tfp pilus assembly protein PilZ